MVMSGGARPSMTPAVRPTPTPTATPVPKPRPRLSMITTSRPLGPRAARTAAAAPGWAQRPELALSAGQALVAGPQQGRPPGRVLWAGRVAALLALEQGREQHRAGQASVAGPQQGRPPVRVLWA